MAKVLNSYLCTGIKKDKQTGKYSPIRMFNSFALAEAPVLFTFVVYWVGKAGESFSQSFALVDEVGNILDEMPNVECVLGNEPETIGAAHFHTVFPRAGCYYINVYQNSICVETVPVNVIRPDYLTIQ